jgi:hypothetical protein
MNLARPSLRDEPEYGVNARPVVHMTPVTELGLGEPVRAILA